ncbi:MAG: M28 family peptidase [Acidobacteriota bacterium]|nr:M28 family peptidase [Acidobacteriota bacterium]
MKKPILAVWSLLILAVPVAAVSERVDLAAVFQAVQSEVSGNRARDYVMRLWIHEKWSTLPEWQKAAKVARDIMAERGFDEAGILGTPADGVTKSCAWTNPIGWDVKQATLEVIDPILPDEFRYLCNYQDNPTSLNAWSAPTPPGGIETELVLMETADPEELGRLDAKGKIVLTGGNTRGLKRFLDRHGILGFVGDAIEENNVDFVNANQWFNGWSDLPGGWWMTSYDSRRNFCFSVSRKKANHLRELLRRGRKVRVRARIDSRYYTDDTLPYVVGVVKGSGSEGQEVLITGHLNEWGANDNSSGVAAILEAVGTLNGLIQSGRLPRPRRSIRVLLGAEMYGSLPYVAGNLEHLRYKTVAAVCLDTTAENYDLATTAFSISMNPNACPTFTDALFPEIVRRYYARYNKDRLWYTMPFSMGTDTYFCEPMIGVPTNWSFMSAGGGHLHHNSMDTIEKVDPRSLRELSFLHAAYLYYVAGAGAADVPFIAGLTFDRGIGVITAKNREMEEKILGAEDGAALGKALAEGLETIRYYTDLQEAAVGSVGKLVPAGDKAAAGACLTRYRKRTDEFGGLLMRQFRETASAKARAASLKIDMPVTPDGSWEKEAATLVPKRFQPGTLFLEEIPPSEWKEIDSSPHWWSATNWASASYWWVDGRRNLNEIKKLCELEAGKPMENFDLISYYKFLEKYKYVEFVKPSAR